MERDSPAQQNTGDVCTWGRGTFPLASQTRAAAVILSFPAGEGTGQRKQVVGGHGTEVCTCPTGAPGVFPPAPPSPSGWQPGSLPESQNLSYPSISQGPCPSPGLGSPHPTRALLRPCWQTVLYAGLSSELGPRYLDVPPPWVGSHGSPLRQSHLLHPNCPSWTSRSPVLLFLSDSVRVPLFSGH